MYGVAREGPAMIIQPDTETLLAVVLGATLATVGGFTERQVERAVQRREKERNAALLFGEILNTMRVILRFGEEARGRGDPYGPITLRFVRAARRETEIYDRNRETLLDLHEALIRAQITTFIARISFSLDGVLDASTELASTEQNLRAIDQNHPDRPELEQRIVALQESRKIAFDFALETAQQIKPLLTSLSPIAKHNFELTEAIARAQ
jgi:hypothetical protein